MAAGEWGVPRDMAHFTLATLAQCGILAVQRQGRTVPLDLMPMTGIESADAIIPGELISQADRETLMTHCPFLAPSGGWPSFGLRQQREAWQALLKFKSSFETVLAETAQRSAAVERYSAFSSFDFASLRETGDALARVLSEIKVSYHAREGVERFLAAWRASGLTAPDVDRIRKTHRFFTRFAENFIHIALYLRHPAVEAACGADAEIARRRDAVALMLDDPLTFVVPDEGTQIGAAFDLFREVYAEGYDRGHRDWNKARQPAKLDRSQERMMQLFDRLSLIEQLDRPPALDALLSSRRNAAAGACGRSVAEELLRSPVCGCGFHLGMAAAGAAADDTGARIDGAFTAYRDILAAPETLEALTAHAFALRDMDGGVAERLDKLAACLRDRKGAPHALLDLLDDRTVAEIGRALSGSMKVQQRSIRSLTDELAGKKLTPRRLRQIFDQWAGQEQENTLLSVDGREPSGGADAQCAPCWWPRLHPGLFGGNAGQVDPDVAGAIGRQLEAHYPAAQLQKRLAALDEGELASFISGESFHTAALQAAWPLLVKRTLEQSAGRFKAPGASRHALPEVADALNSRFKALESAHRWCAEDFPHRLRARVHAAALWTDQWAAAGSRTAADRFIAAVAHQATDWLETLAPVETVDCADSPVVLVLDALAPDVWLETAERLGAALDGAQTGWRRLRSAPGTVDSLAALFAFPADRDPVEAFAVAGATYVTLRGDEERPVTDLIDPLDKDGARIVRFNLLDGAAHGAKLPLNLMPQVLASALSRHLPPLVAQCAARRRPLLLTADHGLSWNKGALTHGKGGVFEEAVVRVTW